MSTFIEFTSIQGNRVMVNIDCIVYFEPVTEGTKIHLCTSHITSSDSSSTLRSVSGYSESVYIMESYELVRRKINEL